MKKVPRDVGTSSQSGIATVAEVMTELVMRVTRQQSIGHVRELLGRHEIHALPVVNAENEPIGIVTTLDLLRLIENKRFVVKNQPSRPKTGGGKRRREEEGQADGKVRE